MPLINMADTVARSATGTYTVRRRPPPTYVKGKAVPSAETTFTIRAAIAPLTGRDLERLIEGTRVEDLIQIVTTSELQTDSVSGEADRIEFGGYFFEVEEVGDWRPLGGFWRCVARRAGKVA